MPSSPRSPNTLQISRYVVTAFGFQHRIFSWSTRTPALAQCFDPSAMPRSRSASINVSPSSGATNPRRILGTCRSCRCFIWPMTRACFIPAISWRATAGPLTGNVFIARRSADAPALRGEDWSITSIIGSPATASVPRAARTQSCHAWTPMKNDPTRWYGSDSTLLECRGRGRTSGYAEPALETRLAPRLEGHLLAAPTRGL